MNKKIDFLSKTRTFLSDPKLLNGAVHKQQCTLNVHQACVCFTCTYPCEGLNDHPLVFKGAGRCFQNGQENLPEKHLGEVETVRELKVVSSFIIHFYFPFYVAYFKLSIKTQNHR